LKHWAATIIKHTEPTSGSGELLRVRFTYVELLSARCTRVELWNCGTVELLNCWKISM
jgi:hypothetical protein